MVSRRFTLACAVLTLVACGSGVLDLLPGDGDASTGDGGTLGDGGSDATTADGARDAGAGDACVGSACPCPSGLDRCDGGCVDLANDPINCGSCGGGCAHYQFCHMRQCTCLPTFTQCGASCIQFSSSPDHCGACNVAPCAAGSRCENSACVSGTTCGAGFLGCNVGGRTACGILEAGVPYCGSCGTVCGPDQTCAAGTCVAYAPATPCAQCPCDADCARAIGAPFACCPGIAGGPPLCVRGNACP